MSEKFDVILADPPWSYRVWDKDTGNGRSASAHYITQSIEDLCAMPIPALAEKNCALFLWCVWPSVFENVPRLLDAWGLKYKTLAFIWVKTNRKSSGLFTGMGYYSRANSEPCLLAVKGSMPVGNRDVLAVIMSAARAHSQKPDEQYAKIERLYPDKRYLELFAREKSRPNWKYWGNEIESDITL